MNSIWFFVLAIFVNLSVSKKFPSYIQRCKRNDPNLNKCFREQLTNIRSHLVKGIPEFQLPPIDPLTIDQVELKTGGGRSVSLNVVFKDIIVKGGKDYQVMNSIVDLDKPEVSMSLYFPLMNLASRDYSVKGRILLLNVDGHGFSDGNYTDIYSTHTVQGNFQNKNGKQYIEWNNRTSNLKITKGHFYFENLINGNPVLSKETNRLLNQESDTILEEFKPLIEDTLNTLVLSMFARVFQLYSLDELFPLN